MEIIGTASFSKCEVVAMEDRKSLVCTEKGKHWKLSYCKAQLPLCWERGAYFYGGVSKVLIFVCLSLHTFALFLSGLLVHLKKSWTKEVGAAGQD